MKPGTLRGRTLLAVFGVSAITLLLAALLIAVPIRSQLTASIQRSLVAEARLAAALLLERETEGSMAALDREADRLGALAAARVTLIADNGVVLGDSAEDLDGLAALDNHGRRPEVLAARREGVGVSRRFSTTVGTNLLYVALPVAHPHVAFVRLALPLTDIDEQFHAVGRSLAVALAVALAFALALAWLSSSLVARRVDAIAAVARRYAAGDFSAPAGDSGGDELGTVARVLDDTARELGRRMTELAQDRARMEAILAGMLEGVIVVNARGLIILANDAARRMVHPEGVTAGQHYIEVLRQPDIGGMMGRALAGQTPEGIEVSPPHDANRTILARAAPITTEGAPGAVLVLHDITDLRRADRMRRDFVANVSHELRTPLTAIQGYVEALQEDVPPEPEEAARFLEIIARQANRMERLVRDLLRLARLEGGQEPVEPSRTVVDTLFAHVVTELEGALEAKGQRVVTDIETAAATLQVDTAKLHDALRNLVENAVAYAPPSTTITLASRREDREVVITVADEGSGIPEADLTRVFERFYRVDKARSRESGGTGLGLSIVKHLVEILGGDVKAANRPAGGAVFTITLPAA